MKTTFTAADGVPLQLRRWAAQGASRGSVLLVHGLGEHSGRYEAVAARLTAWGWTVVGYDQRGHGRSGGARGAIDSPDALLRDLGDIVDLVRADAGSGPLVLLGHSLGGLIAARFVAEGLGPSPAVWHRRIDALVLSSPALDPGMNGAQKLLLAVLGPLAPNLAVSNGLKPEWISRDPAIVQAYVDDPLVHDRVTPQLVRFIADAGVLARERAEHWRTPTLLMWAGSDRCVAPAGSVAFAEAAPAARVTSHAFALLFHELFNEPEKDQVFEVLSRWLAARSDAPPSRH